MYGRVISNSINQQVYNPSDKTWKNPRFREINSKIPAYHTQKRNIQLGEIVSRIYHTRRILHQSVQMHLQKFYSNTPKQIWNETKKICAFHFNLSVCLFLFCFYSLFLSSVDHFRAARSFCASARMHWTQRDNNYCICVHIEYTNIFKCIKNWNESVPSFIAYTQNTHVNNTLVQQNTRVIKLNVAWIRHTAILIPLIFSPSHRVVLLLLLLLCHWAFCVQVKWIRYNTIGTHATYFVYVRVRVYFFEEVNSQN